MNVHYLFKVTLGTGILDLKKIISQYYIYLSNEMAMVISSLVY